MKSIVTIFILCLVLNNAYSQADSSKTGTKVIFFGANRNKEAKVYNGNAVKFGLADIASGLYGMHYERELGEVFSVQAGAGLTGRNFMEGLLSTALVDDPANETSNNSVIGAKDILDNYWEYTSRSSSIGYFIEIQPKLFLSEDGFDGSYFGINFQYRRYNFSAQNVDPTKVKADAGSDGLAYSDVKFINSNPLSEYQNETIIAVSYGHQWTGDKTIVEESISMGLRNISGQRRDIWQYVSNDGNGNYYSQPFALLNNVSKSQFYFEFTLKIGLWWANKK
jgi:hypothetical protein